MLLHHNQLPLQSSSANSLNPPLLATFNLTLQKPSIPSIFIISMMSSKSPKTLRSSTPSSSAISASSAEIVGSDDDLLFLILLRLPIKSLLKFKSVSKHWLSMVSDPLFSHRRTSLNRPTASGLFVTRSGPKYDFINLTPFPYVPPFGSLSFGHQTAGILQSCNGLLLCVCNDLSANYYFVYNPTTKQYSRLPQLQGTDRDSSFIYAISLAFEPSKSSYYKVVCVRNDNSSSDNHQIYIYSSAGGPWRKSRAILSRYVDMSHGVYCNGAIHWISIEISSTYFDINEETFHEMSMPEIPDGWHYRNVGYFGESGGRLLLMELYEPETKFDIYEMEEDRSGWFVKYIVDLETAKLNFPEFGILSGLRIWEPEYYGFSLLCVAEEGEVEDGSYMILNIPGKLIRYNFKSKTWDVIFETDDEQEVDGWLYRWTHAYQYMECLSCV